MDTGFDRAFEKMGLDRAERHIFLCIGPDCCGGKEGQAMWKTVKRAIKDHDLPIMRSKSGCLRICRGGPWMVVYPEGIWYGALTDDRFDRILKEHLIGGRPVEEWVAARRKLPE